jgi:thiol-disulfide isomerase/thioredoxin
VSFLLALVLAAATNTGLASVRYGVPPPNFPIAGGQGAQTLRDLRGRPVVINFWASWCPPCKQEMPYFKRLQATYGDRVRVITVDWNEDPANAVGFLREQHLQLPVVSDRQSKIYAAYSLTEVPDTLVLDAAGNVTYVSVGGLSWPELSAAVSAVL